MKDKDPIAIIGSALCILALVFFSFRSCKQAKEAAAIQQNAPIVTSTESTDTQAVAPQAALAEQPAVPEVPAEFPQQVKREAAVLTVPGQFQVTIDTMGNGVQSVKLENYTIQTKDEEKKDTPVVMGQGAVPFLNLSAKGQHLYEIAEPEVTEDTVTTHRMDASKSIRYDETWSVVPGDAQNPYAIRYTLKVTNATENAIALPQLSLSSGVMPDFLSDESNTSFSRYLSGCVAYGRVQKDDCKMLMMKDITKKMDQERIAEYQNTPANWVGVSSKYFLFALREPVMDNQPTAFAGFAANAPKEFFPRELFHADAILPVDATLSAGASKTYAVTGYAGPKSYQLLEPMGHGIASILNMDLFFFWHYDWMGWLCKMLLKALNGIAAWFSGSYGYGIAIILITLLVKLVFAPLVWKSTRSMKKMSAVQPQLKALRERFKDDPQRMYYEQQKLFKENGVSQTGGCLPMLVQIPVFFAMFNTFRGAIEIRNASFLWVADLSMPDPIFGLPIHPLAIMTGATMYFQQRLQPMPDPNQAKMMNIMSLVFVFFFYNMPAGLTLYMTINQLTSIIQMLIFRKLEKQNGVTTTVTSK